MCSFWSGGRRDGRGWVFQAGPLLARMVPLCELDKSVPSEWMLPHACARSMVWI